MIWFVIEPSAFAFKRNNQPPKNRSHSFEKLQSKFPIRDSVQAIGQAPQCSNFANLPTFDGVPCFAVVTFVVDKLHLVESLAQEEKQRIKKSLAPYNDNLLLAYWGNDVTSGFGERERLAVGVMHGVGYKLLRLNFSILTSQAELRLSMC